MVDFEYNCPKRTLVTVGLKVVIIVRLTLNIADYVYLIKIQWASGTITKEGEKIPRL